MEFLTLADGIREHVADTKLSLGVRREPREVLLKGGGSALVCFSPGQCSFTCFHPLCSSRGILCASPSLCFCTGVRDVLTGDDPDPAAVAAAAAADLVVLSMYICDYVYIYIYMYMYVCIYECMHVYVYMYMYMYVYVCICICICMCPQGFQGYGFHISTNRFEIILAMSGFIRCVSLFLRIECPLTVYSLSSTVSFHNFKSQNFKLSVSNPKSKYVAYLSVLSQISNCQGLGHKNKHEILKTDRIHGVP